MKRRWGSILEFTLPIVILFLGFKIIPLIITFFNSDHTLRMDLGMKSEFIGLQNYIKILTADKTFRMATLHSATWAVISPLLEIPIAFTLAYILRFHIKRNRFFRIAWFFPVLISWVVIGAIFRWILNNDWGVVNTILRGIGLGGWAINWLGEPLTALPTLIAITTWRWIGWNFVILLAAIGSIPQDIIDATRIDGVRNIHLITQILFPLLRPIIGNLMILCFVGKMRLFDLVWVMTGGGPLGSTETVGTYIQKRAFAWHTLDLGYPSAIAVLWFFVVVICWFLLRRLFRVGESYEF